MTPEEAEAQFWLVFRFCPAVPYMPIMVFVAAWFVILPAAGLFLALWCRETRWALRHSRSTSIWFWVTYLGSSAVVAAHVLLGPSAKFAINAFAVPFLVASVLGMFWLWVGTWVRLAETYASEAVERLALARVEGSRQSPRL